MSNRYEFVTVWRVAGTVAEVKEILGDATTLPVWWPSVYLDVTEVSPAGPDGTGRTVDVLTKGWLPYTIRWRIIITEPVSDSGFALQASGDFAGSGRWIFRQDGPEVEVSYDWRIAAEKPLLRRLTWILRPAFAANHRWAMTRGEESLKLELRRRRATSDEARHALPLPPQPSFVRRRS